MLNRSLAIVAVLLGGDYLLWTWSMSGNHDLAGLISGLTLPPLAIAFLWMVALRIARLLGRAALSPRRSRARTRRLTLRRRRRSATIMETGNEEQAASGHASSSSQIAA